jgi:multiple sugar transport system permease protein/putative aldouronate transport system permease protein
MTLRFSHADKTFQAVCITILGFAGIVVLYPLIYVISCSFSATDAIVTGKVFLWPVDITLDAYKAILNYSMLPIGFLNSLIYVAGGTVVAVSLVILAGYPMSRKELPFRKIIQTFFVITMFFGGGLIPSYILMMRLHLVGSRWSQIIAVGFSCYNMIIVKSYFQTSLPQGLLDAARIDGCGDIQFFFRIALPLATPVIAVMVLFNAVGIWNGYFSGLLYLSKPELFNFQMVLRDILLAAMLPPEMMMRIDPRQLAIMTRILQQLKYSVLVVGALPMMILYPFIQKYFIRGMMIGSLKE